MASVSFYRIALVQKLRYRVKRSWTQVKYSEISLE